MELPENTSMNEHTIKLVKDKQPPYGPIYSLGLVELETLKTYIKTHLKTGFIRPSKSPTGVSIFFDQKPDGSLRFCIDYQGLNNRTIKNRYPLPLIDETFDKLGWAKHFTQFNLMSVYHKIRIWKGNK